VATPEALSSTAIRGSLAIAPVGTRGTEVSPQEEILWALEEKAPRYNEWLLSRALPHLGGHVLEIGAGIGTFSLLLATHGIRVSALEPDEELADVLEERASDLAGIDVLRGDIEGFAVDRPAEPFDSVICFNVLEHIPDDHRALGDIYESLAPGGKMVLWVPAFESLYGKFDQQIGHYRRYRHNQLLALVHKVGFQKVSARYTNMPGFFAWWLVVRLLGRAPTSGRLASIYDRYFFPVISRVERFVRPPLGQSLLVVAQRS
jgi:SAM-dependent methyltransferase